MGFLLHDKMVDIGELLSEGSPSDKRCYCAPIVARVCLLYCNQVDQLLCYNQVNRVICCKQVDQVVCYNQVNQVLCYNQVNQVLWCKQVNQVLYNQVNQVPKGGIKWLGGRFGLVLNLCGKAVDPRTGAWNTRAFRNVHCWRAALDSLCNWYVCHISIVCHR